MLTGFSGIYWLRSKHAKRREAESSCLQHEWRGGVLEGESAFKDAREELCKYSMLGITSTF